MEGANEKILTREELKTGIWEQRMQQSIELAKNPETREDTDISVAQEALVNFIINLGGVRMEVLELILTPAFPDVTAVASVRSLLCYAAPVEWIRLAVLALRRDKVSGVIYVNEITEAYEQGIPLEKVEGFLEKSNTAFEMCQYRMNYAQNMKLHDRVTGSEKKEHSGNVTGSDKKRNGDNVTESDMSEVVKNAVVEALRVFVSEKTSGNSSITASSEDVDFRDNSTGGDETELHDSVTGSSEKTEFYDSVAESEGEIPEFPDGRDVMETGIFVTELEKEEQQYGKRVSFFQLLLNRHMKKEFLKLDEEAQVGKIFEIMVGKRYEKGKILAIRRLMNGGMSKEFIFSLLEKDLSEKELNDLCDTLLDEEPGERTGTDKNIDISVGEVNGYGEMEQEE